LLSHMNEAILTATGSALLMTCVIAIINPKDRQIIYANAGHNYPYLLRHGARTIEMLQSVQCFPLGFVKIGAFEENTISFNAGDSLVLYSDGVNECSNGHEDYGYMRFEKRLSSLAGRPPRDCVHQILESLVEFRGTERLEDDISLVIARLKDAAMPDYDAIPGSPFNSVNGE
jgi:phosphoserine phosphatase RsbU/P